ncbi:MAG: phosphoribosyl-AMP cyclohydrolase [Nitrososphaeria archaeon]
MKFEAEDAKVETLVFNENELIPVVVQDAKTKEILMVAYANKEAVQKTLETGYAHFWSRKRKKLWKKGETSGNFIKVEKILVDCDNDTLIYLSNPAGPVCHTGRTSCFFKELKI